MCIVFADINECLEAALAGSTICNATMSCVNTEGSSMCICVEGTELVNGVCREIGMLAKKEKNLNTSNIEYYLYPLSVQCQECHDSTSCGHTEL